MLIAIVRRNSSSSMSAYAEWRPMARSGQSSWTVAPASAIASYSARIASAMANTYDSWSG